MSLSCVLLSVRRVVVAVSSLCCGCCGRAFALLRAVRVGCICWVWMCLHAVGLVGYLSCPFCLPLFARHLLSTHTVFFFFFSLSLSLSLSPFFVSLSLLCPPLLAVSCLFLLLALCPSSPSLFFVTSLLVQWHVSAHLSDCLVRLLIRFFSNLILSLVM